MIAVLLRLVEFPDGRFFSPGVPLMLSVFLPSIQHRFVLPLIWRASKDEGLFFPDAAAGKVKSGIGKSTTEVQAFGVGMKNIDACIIGHNGFGVFERSQEKFVEFIVGHVIISDLSG